MKQEELSAFLPTTRCKPSEKKALKIEAELEGRSLGAHIRHVLFSKKVKK